MRGSLRRTPPIAVSKPALVLRICRQPRDRVESASVGATHRLRPCLAHEVADAQAQPPHTPEQAARAVRLLNELPSAIRAAASPRLSR